MDLFPSARMFLIGFIYIRVLSLDLLVFIRLDQGFLNFFTKFTLLWKVNTKFTPKIQSSVYLLRAQKRSFKLNFWLKLKFVLIF